MSRPHSVVDEHGTPIREIYIGNLVNRQIAELLGLSKGIICDGIVVDAEVVALKQWISANPDAVGCYPGNLLAPRLTSMMEDGVSSDTECSELKELLLSLVGEPADLTGTMNAPTALPLDDPPPPLTFAGQEYVFTGVFASATRDECEQEVVKRGGRCWKTVTRRTSVLVIAMFSSPAWVQSTHGRKIERAMELRAQGHPIHIVSEEHWLAALKSIPALQ